MRIYSNFKEAFSEIPRDLKEMGIKINTQTWQDKSRKEGYSTHELQNYIYTVTRPDVFRINPNQPWADHEFQERINQECPVNPGEAWKFRRDIWEDLLEPSGRFSYTYSERLFPQLKHIIHEIVEHPNSRQLYLGIWNPGIDFRRFGIRRVPCSLGYYFQYRNRKLNITYLQRSCDFTTHFENDVYLAAMLQVWVCHQVNEINPGFGCFPGTFTHWIGSLHVFEEDVKYVF